MATRRYCTAFLCGLWAVATPLAGHADDAEMKPVENKIVIGAATEAVLKLQREGTAAGAIQPISGEVARRSYQRYLDSFAKPMPEYNQTVGTSMDSGSAQ